MVYTGPSIVDYLSSLGQASDFNTRTGLAQKQGITNYSGTAAQNTQLLNSLRGSTSSSPNIPVDQIGPAKPVGVTNPQDSGMAGAAVEGARMSAQQFYDMQQYAQTPEQQDAKRLREEASAGVEQLAGRGAAQLAEEERLGVNTLNQELAGLNAQILSKTAEYNQLNQSIEGKPITMSSIIGEQAQVRKMAASEIGMLQSLALGKQGMLSAAQDAADRAIDLKYEDIETQYTIRIKQLELLQPLLDAEEKKRSNALELYLNQEKERVAEQKAAAKDFQNDKLNAITKGMSVATAQQVDRLFNEGKIDEAYSIMGGYTRSGTTGSAFTNSQINKGASIAGLSIDEFKGLDEDSQNFFVNNVKEINDQKAAIDDAILLEEDPNALEDEIMNYDIPDAVKDSLVKYLKTTYADEYAAFSEEVSPESESDSGTPWWKGLIGIGQLGR